MKRFLCILAVSAMLVFSFCITAGANEAAPVAVTLNGKTVDCASYGQEATIVEGRTLVPLRAIFEALGASVEWNGETKIVTSKLGENEVSFTIGENKLIKNGEEIALDVPAMIMNGRTLVPVRAVSEAFGVSVEWESETRTVILNKKLAPFGNLMFDMSKEEALAVIEGKTEIYDTRIDIWDTEDVYNDDDNIVFGKGINCEYISLDFRSVADGEYLDVITARTGYVSLNEANRILENMQAYYSRFEEYVDYDDSNFYCFSEDEFECCCVYGGIIKSEDGDKYYCYITMSPISFGGIRRVDKTGRLVYMDWYYAYGDFYFGMTKEDVCKILGCEIIEDDKYSIVVDEETSFAIDDDIISGELLRELEFRFYDDKLVKIILIAETSEENEFSQITDALRECYGEPEKVKKDGDELVWLINDEGVEVTAIKYITPQYFDIEETTNVEIELKYIGIDMYDKDEKNGDEEVEKEPEYIYGKMYFGMELDETKDAFEQIGFQLDYDTESLNSDKMVRIADKENVYNDEDETVTGKTNIKAFDLGFEKNKLKSISLRTDFMTREEADFIIASLTERYSTPSIMIKDPEIYEWMCDDKTVYLEVHNEKNDKDDSMDYYAVIEFRDGKFVVNQNYNILRQMPIGFDLERTSQFFKKSTREFGEDRVQFFDIYDPSKSELIYSNVNMFSHNVSVVTYSLDYNEDDDIFGQNFKCSYVSVDLIDGVSDNCFAKTVAVSRYSAVHTLNYIAKYFGADKAVFNEEKFRYEWKNYKYPDKRRGIENVNIYAGIAGDGDDCYCYVSIIIADSDRYNYVDDSGRINGHDYPRAYGKLYFGMTVEQAKRELLGEIKTDYNRLFVYDSDSKFDDEDKNITIDANAEMIELAFDNKTKKLCSVKVTTSEISEEETKNILANVKKLYGDEESSDEKDGIGYYVWLDRKSGFEIKLDTEKIADTFVCTYSITVAGSDMAKI